MGASQTEQILEYLKQGKTLTPLDALIKFHCLRLAARIGELREAGYKIVTGEKELANGKRVAEYRLQLEPAPPPRHREWWEGRSDFDLSPATGIPMRRDER